MIFKVLFSFEVLKQRVSLSSFYVAIIFYQIEKLSLLVFTLASNIANLPNNELLKLLLHGNIKWNTHVNAEILNFSIMSGRRDSMNNSLSLGITVEIFAKSERNGRYEQFYV